MKHALLALALFAALPLQAADDLWTTDYKAALATAKAENRPILLEFTGSDWCPPCKRLAKNILSTDSFQGFAEDNLVLVKLDFPRNKPQTDEVRAQNQELKAEYKIRGYPTIVLLDSEGSELARKVGYPGGDADSFIGWIESSTR